MTKEERKQYMREYRKANRKKCLALCSKYYRDNKERISAYKKQWYLKRKEALKSKNNVK